MEVVKGTENDLSKGSDEEKLRMGLRGGVHTRWRRDRDAKVGRGGTLHCEAL